MSKEGASSHDEKLHDDDKGRIGGSDSDLEALPEVLKETHKADQYDVSIVLPGMLGTHEENDVDPEESRRVKAKLDKRIIPLVILIYTLQWLDKNAMGASTILGFLTDNKLTNAELNNLGTFFYVGYLVGQWPHAIAFQKLPVAKYLAFQMYLWALLVGCHAAAKGYHQLIALRILLGITEGCITPGVILICSMFYKRIEMAERVGWAFQCSGIAQIVSGFIAFGVYHAPANTPQHPQKVAQWQWFMIVVTTLTVITATLFVLIFPDNPTKARFLTEHEKVIAVKRCRETQSGVETKVWKKYQFIEAITDPKMYIFMLFVSLSNFIGGIGNQYSLIIKDFGFTIEQTTLLNMPSGAVTIISVTATFLVLRKFPNSRAWISVWSYAPSLVFVILLITLPNTRVGLLICYYFLLIGATPAAVISLSWVATTTSGHTKKLTHNAMWVIAYSVGQMVSPQWWQAKYKPRNRVPWAIILTSFCCQILIILFLRWFLNRRNRLRDEGLAAATTEEEREKYSEYAWIEVPSPEGDGKTKRVRVEKRLLDLTDSENLNFRYAL